MTEIAAKEQSTCQGRVALVTGASGGIGQAIALALARAGAHVSIGYYRQHERAQALSRRIEALGVHALPLQADLTKAADAASLVERTEAALGRVDILVNNAGTALAKLLIDTTLDEWEAMMAIHLRGAFACTKAALPGMIRRRYGRIINISSMWGQVGAANEVAYSTAKAGLIGFTKALAQEVGLCGITVNAVAPGAIETDMLADYSPEEQADLVARTPVGRLGTPADVARVVRWLAEDDSDFMTGQIIAPNGGIIV